MNKAFVSEIFPTVQGEGPFAGERQVFVRLAGCPLRCRYCDTPESLTINAHRSYSVPDVLSEVLAIARKEDIHVVSVTGGEPLAQAPFLKELFPHLKEAGLSLYLETAGLDPAGLEMVLPWCDVIAMDIKLPSATRTAFWDQHADFLQLSKGKVFVKVVIEKTTRLWEIQKTISLLEAVTPPPPLVFQPVSPQPPDVEEPSDEKIQSFLQIAREKLPDVQVLIQQHKVLGHR